MSISLRPLALMLALTAWIGPAADALAEGSESETPLEEQQLAYQSESARTYSRAASFAAYLADLDRRYSADSVDVVAFLNAEGEMLARRYCALLGFSGPCTVATVDGVQRYVEVGAAPPPPIDPIDPIDPEPLPPPTRLEPEPYWFLAPAEDSFDATTAPLATKTTLSTQRVTNHDLPWWFWLANQFYNVGVIPEGTSCPSNTHAVSISMDDEDRRNANSRSGWIGGITSDRNTTLRFCKIESVQSLDFRPLDKPSPITGDSYDYSVLSLGAMCPPGSRRMLRVQENEIWRNRNGWSGAIFPNYVEGNHWYTFYCHFEGGSGMSQFPWLGMSYGVFASKHLPDRYAIARGYLHQDDEDFLNSNSWSPRDGGSVMNGGRNTSRWLAKVR